MGLVSAVVSGVQRFDRHNNKEHYKAMDPIAARW